MSTARKFNKEGKRHKEVIEKLIAPLSKVIVDFTFIKEKGRCFIPVDFEKSVEIANGKYNVYATKHNKKSRDTILYNAVREEISIEIAKHEYNIYIDCVIENINTKYGILAHTINKNKELLEKSYVKGLSIDEAVIYINSEIKK